MVRRKEDKREFWRKYFLDRYNRQIDALKEKVEVCLPSAVSDIRTLTHNIYVSVKNGEIYPIDYNELDRKIEELTREFMRRCVCR